MAGRDAGRVARWAEAPDRARALEIAERETSVEALLPALKALAGAAAEPSVKDMLLRRYAWFDAHGERRDRYALARTGIIQAIGEAFTGGDAAFLVHAVETPEFERGGNPGAPLRAAALAALDAVDVELAADHAALLIADAQGRRRASEAAVAAVRVLARQERTAPLLLLALTERTHPVLVSECLRGLSAAGAAVVTGLLERMPAEPEPAVTVGLVDLMVQHRDWRRFADRLFALVRAEIGDEAHAYAVTSIVGTRRPELVERLIAEARLERDAGRIANLVEALRLRPDDPAAAEAASALEARR